MKASVQHFAMELNRLCKNEIPMNKAFDMLEQSASNCMDLIVINVMRDSYRELINQENSA